MGIFLGEGGAGRFLKWSISSLVRVQIAQELVRLISLIGLNKLSSNITSPKTLKIFHARHFDDPSSKNEHFWRFKNFYKQNYLLYALLKETWGNCAEEVCPSFFHRTSAFFSRNSGRFTESSRVSREKCRGPMERRRAYFFLSLIHIWRCRRRG